MRNVYRFTEKIGVFLFFLSLGSLCAMGKNDLSSSCASYNESQQESAEGYCGNNSHLEEWFEKHTPTLAVASTISSNRSTPCIQADVLLPEDVYLHLIDLSKSDNEQMKLFWESLPEEVCQAVVECEHSKVENYLYRYVLQCDLECNQLKKDLEQEAFLFEDSEETIMRAIGSLQGLKSNCKNSSDRISFLNELREDDKELFNVVYAVLRHFFVENVNSPSAAFYKNVYSEYIRDQGHKIKIEDMKENVSLHESLIAFYHRYASFFELFDVDMVIAKETDISRDLKDKITMISRVLYLEKKLKNSSVNVNKEQLNADINVLSEDAKELLTHLLSTSRS